MPPPEDRYRRALSLVRELAGTTDPDALYRRVLDGVLREFPAERGAVLRRQTLRGAWRLLAAHGDVRALPAGFPDGQPLLRKLVEATEGLVFASEDSAAALAALGSGTASLLAVRFRVEADESEALILESSEPQRFSHYDARLLKETLSTLEAALLNRYARTRADRELDLLMEVARGDRDWGRELDEAELPRLLHKVLEIALSLTRCRTGAALLVDEETGNLHIEAETFSLDRPGRIPKVLKKRADRPSGIVFRVLDENRSYLANDTTQDPHYISVFEETRASLAVPISFQDRCIGVVLVEAQAPRHFTAEHQRLVESLAATASSFVRRAQLYRATKKGAPGGGILIKGRGRAWDEVERRIERAAATSATVCLRGESGTGKELVAHAIHFNSARSKEPFVVVNCAAIPGELLESELFGHVRGAFTGAVSDRHGQFEIAHGGTIFLDEIGDLPPGLQVKLLRVLQSGETRRVGSDEARRVDVRVIAATSRDLETMMGLGQFREDLYFRLMVVPMYLPPLRDYAESIPGMVRQFLHDANVRYGRSVSGVGDGVMDVLMGHGYPGNVRELRNVVEQAVLMAGGNQLAAGDLPGYLRGEAPPPPMPRSLAAKPRASQPGAAAAPIPSSPPVSQSRVAAAAPPSVASGPPTPVSAPLPAGGLHNWDFKTLRDEVLRDWEGRYLDALLESTGGNVTRAAELAGVHRVNLHRMLKRRSEAEGGPAL
jgi:transcriptional regulator with GAF, ATPase, and Fis domain